MDPAKRTRLIQLLGMIGSAHDGEVLNAAKLAQRLIGSEGMTWEEVLTGVSNGPDLSRKAIDDAYFRGFNDGKAFASSNKPRVTWQAVARDLRDNHEDELTEWEQGFVESFCERRWAQPTPKQRAIFERISDRIGCELPE